MGMLLATAPVSVPAVLVTTNSHGVTHATAAQVYGIVAACVVRLAFTPLFAPYQSLSFTAVLIKLFGIMPLFGLFVCFLP